MPGNGQPRSSSPPPDKAPKLPSVKRSSRPASPATSRRDFLRTTAIASSAFLAGCQTRTASVLTPSDRAKVRLAVIGIGGRGDQIIEAFAQTDLVEFVAAADVDLHGPHTAGGRAKLGGIPMYQDFRDMLDRHGRGIDAVAIATPDHSHFPLAMACMAAGKHVYVEKPLAQSFQEVEILIEQARRTGVVTQMGNQGHSGANYFQFKAWSEAGIIKEVTRVDAYMNSARRWHGWDISGFPTGETPPDTIDWDLWQMGRPSHEFSEKFHPGNWRSWFAYGSGAFGDWAPHIVDTAHRFLELGLPEKISAERRDGPNEFIFPQASTIRFSFPARGAHPPCDILWQDGIENLPSLPREEGPNPERQPHGKYIYSHDHVFKGGTHSATLRILPTTKMRELAPALPRITGRHSDHFANFALACLGREDARSPFGVSGPLSQVFLLGIIAQRLGGDFRFDRATKRFVAHPLANDLLGGPPPRPGWESLYRI